MVEIIGFEPIHPKELIYSQPPHSNLAASPLKIKLFPIPFLMVSCRGTYPLFPARMGGVLTLDEQDI